jgi:hypothetical protein
MLRPAHILWLVFTVAVMVFCYLYGFPDPDEPIDYGW